MTYVLEYHKDVIRQDIPALSGEWRKWIKRAIENRLVVHPELYSKPLRKSLKGYRKLRVGDWRVIFRIQTRMVKILVIKNRSIVYKTVVKRLTQ